LKSYRANTQTHTRAYRLLHLHRKYANDGELIEIRTKENATVHEVPCCCSNSLGLYIKHGKVSVRYVYVTDVRNDGRGQLSSEWRHNENDVTAAIAGLWRYGDWRHMATGCTAIVWNSLQKHLRTVGNLFGNRKVPVCAGPTGQRRPRERSFKRCFIQWGI